MSSEGRARSGGRSSVSMKATSRLPRSLQILGYSEFRFAQVPCGSYNQVTLQRRTTEARQNGVISSVEQSRVPVRPTRLRSV
jgi:hypothetical protein